MTKTRVLVLALYFFLGSVWGNSAPTVSPRQTALLFSVFRDMSILTPQEEKTRAQFSHSGDESLQKLCITHTVDAPCWWPVVPPLEFRRPVPTGGASLLRCINLLTHLTVFFPISTYGGNFLFQCWGKLSELLFRYLGHTPATTVSCYWVRMQKPPKSIFALSLCS